MKILLIFPPEPQETLVNTVPPIGLLALASSLIEAGHEVKVMDCFSFGFDENDYIEMLRDWQPDVVGISGMSVHHAGILKIAGITKKNSNAVVAAGGIHATVMPELVLQNEDIDIVMLGEADHTFAEYLRFLEDGVSRPDMEGIGYRDNGGTRKTSPSIVKDINSLPFPAYQLAEPSTYKGAPHGIFYKNWPIGSIITSRGCPMLCTFCAAKSINLRQWRPLSAEKVIDEICYLKDRFGVKEIAILDDNFTLNRKRVVEICRHIIDMKSGLTLSCPNGLRVETLDEDLLRMMKKAGFYNFSLGIESGSARIQNMIKKNLDLGMTKEKIIQMKKMGMDVTGFFIIGFPFETEKDINDTIDYALSLPLDMAAFTIFIPLPGSESFEVLVKEGRIDPRNFDWNRRGWVSGSSGEIYEHLSPDTVVRLHRMANRKFYFRPSIVLKSIVRLAREGKPEAISMALKRLYNNTFSK